MRVLLEEGRDFALEQTISHAVRQDDLPHVDIFLVKGIVQLDALQLVGALPPLLQKLLPPASLPNAPLKVRELLLSELAVALLVGSAVSEGLIQLVQFLLLVNEGFL